MKEVYLGDGLYASDDGFQICLRAPRGHEDHLVYLEPGVLSELMRFIESSRGLKIKVERVEGIDEKAVAEEG